MQLHYHRDIRGNFGDDLNPPFFDFLCPGHEKADFDRLIGIGTLLNESLGKVQNSIIFGSGYGQGIAPQIDFATTKILGVRGPITAEALGLEATESVIGDPALYLPKISTLNGGTSPAPNSIVIALHHRTAELWQFPAEEVSGVCFLDPGKTDLVDYIETIKSAKYVVAEAMHGAIVAAAYNVPFVKARILGKTNRTKWDDFLGALSMQCSEEVVLPIPEPAFSRRAAIKAASVLKSEAPMKFWKNPEFGEEYVSRAIGLSKSHELQKQLMSIDKGTLDYLVAKIERAACILRDLVGSK